MCVCLSYSYTQINKTRKKECKQWVKKTDTHDSCLFYLYTEINKTPSKHDNDWEKKHEWWMFVCLTYTQTNKTCKKKHNIDNEREKQTNLNNAGLFVLFMYK